MFKTIRRSISTITASTLVLGLLAFIPSTFAASLSIDPQTQTTFNITSQDMMNFGVTMKDYDKNYGVGFSMRGPLGNNEKLKLLEVHNYTGNDTYTFKWDGKIDGVDVVPGKYRAEFSNIGLNPNPLTYEFDVVTTQPILTFNPNPAANYEIGSGNYYVSAILSNYVADTDVNLYVYKKGSQDKPIIQTQTYEQNGTLQFTWNGKIDQFNPQVGTYVVELRGKDDNGNSTNIESREFQVVVDTEKAKIAFTTMPDNEYELNSNDDYEASVKLTGSDNIEVVATIDGPGNIELESKRVMDDGETFVFSWDEDDLDTLGDYDLVIEGVGLYNNLSRSFEVVKASDDDSCAGYEDMDENDEGCDAVEWAKEEGIMEGNPDGTFEPYDIFQRDEAAKVSLEAFNLFNENTDYCKGDDPFPDVNRKAWHGDYICRGVDIDMVTGYKSGPDAGLFKPERGLNLVEMFALILRNVDEPMPKDSSFNNNFDATQWYAGYAAYAYENSLYPSSNGLSPTHQVNRLEIAMFLYELHKDGEI